MNLRNLTIDQVNEKLDNSNLKNIVIPAVVAICPILQHYKGLFLNISSWLLILCFPLILYLVYLTARRTKLSFKTVIPLALYALYVSFVHGVSLQVLGREMILLLIFIGIENKSFSMDMLIKIMALIAQLATVILIIQYISYYAFSKHLQFVPTCLLVDSAEQWKGLAETGRISVTGARMAFYRPSAFFLEPSHFAIYSVSPIAVYALRMKRDRKEILQAIFISLGVILSTSGMGLVLVFFIWALYGIFRLRTEDKAKSITLEDLKNPRIYNMLAALLVAFILMYATVDIFQMAVDRIFIPSDGKNAIQGRTATAISSIGKMKGADFIFGVGSRLPLSEWNIPGLFYTFIKYGFIGFGLIYYWYIKNLSKLDRELFWLGIIIIALSFFTVHTYAAFYRLVFISLLMNGLLKKKQPVK